MTRTYENFEEWLEEHDTEIRAKAIKEFAEWLETLSYTKNAPISSDVYIPNLIYDYEREQK